VTLLQQEGWTRWPTEVPSNPYHSVILWFTEVWSPSRGQKRLSPTADCWSSINHLSDPNNQITPKLQRKAKERLHIPANLTVLGRKERGQVMPRKGWSKFLTSWSLWQTSRYLKYSMSAIWGGCSRSEVQSYISVPHNTTLDTQKLVLQFLFQKFTCWSTQTLP